MITDLLYELARIKSELITVAEKLDLDPGYPSFQMTTTQAGLIRAVLDAAPDHLRHLRLEPQTGIDKRPALFARFDDVLTLVAYIE